MSIKNPTSVIPNEQTNISYTDIYVTVTFKYFFVMKAVTLEYIKKQRNVDALNSTIVIQMNDII